MEQFVTHYMHDLGMIFIKNYFVRNAAVLAIRNTLINLIRKSHAAQ